MESLAQSHSKKMSIHPTKIIFITVVVVIYVGLCIFVEYTALTSADPFLHSLGFIFIAIILKTVRAGTLLIRGLYGEIIRRVNDAGRYVKKTALQAHNASPTSAFIAVTRHCQKFCSHCYEYNNSKPIMTDKLHREVINKLYEIGVAFVFYYGGEPASHPSIVSFIKYAKRCGMCVTVCSDISSSNQELLLEILSAGADIISFSVNSTIDVGDRKIGIIKKNLKFFQDLRREGWRFGLNCSVVVHKGNIDEIRDIVQLVENYGKTSFSIQPAQYPVPYPQVSKKTDLMLTKEDVPKINEIVSWLERRNDGKGIFPPGDYLRNFHKFLEGRHRWDCGTQRDMLFIDCDGSLRVCSYFIEQDPPLPLIPLKMTYKDLTPNHWENVMSVIEHNWEHCNTECYTQAYYCSRYYNKHYVVGLLKYLKMYI